MITPRSPFQFESDRPSALAQVLAALGKMQPVYYHEERRYWIILRYHDIQSALRNPELFSNSIYRQGPVGDTFIATDGKAHLHYRRMYGGIFTPHAIRGYEEAVIVPIVRRLLDRIAAKPGCDLVDDFCIPLPIEVITTLLDMTPDYVEPCRAWISALAAWNLALDDADVGAAGRAMRRQMEDHIRPVVERQLVHPGPGFLGGIIRAYQEEMGHADPEQIMGAAVGMMLAGYETTTWMLACALSSLLLHPAALQRVRGDSALLMPAVEESMRWAPSTIGALRRATRDADVSGVTIPGGASVFVCTAAAHHDDAIYPDPDVYDIDRRPEHLLFLPGPHHCLGAPLARMEARVGLGMLLERLPELRLDPEHRPLFSMAVRGSAMYGPTNLRVLN